MSDSIVSAVGQALLHLVWQGALVAGLLAVALQATPARAARIRYALACAAMLALISLPVLTTLQGLEGYQGGIPQIAPRIENGLEVPLAPAALIPLAGPVHYSAWLQVIGVVQRHASQIVFLWLFGVLLGALRMLAGWLRLRRIVGAAEPVGEEWRALLARLSFALRVSRPVRLLASRELDVPSAIGWLKPVVLVPFSVIAGLPSQELELVLAHELAHIRRHDYLVNLLQTGAETILFYHPAVWWIGRVIRVERENCCDDLALKTGATPLAYARALTALESLRNLAPIPSSMSPSPGLSALGGSLPSRVQRLLLPSPRCASSWSIGTSIASLILGLALTIPLAGNAFAKLQARVMPSPRSFPVDHTLEQMQPPQKEVAAADDGALSVDQIVELHNAGVDASRVRTFRSALGVELSVDELIELAHAGVTPELLKNLGAVFGKRLALADVIALHQMGVTSEYVRGLESLGFTDLTPDQAIQARATGVTVEYAEEMKKAGVLPRKLERVIQLRMVGIDGPWMEGLRAAGIDTTSLDDLEQLRVIGVNGDYVQRMKAAGLRNLSVAELERLKQSGVTPEYLEQLHAK